MISYCELSNMLWVALPVIYWTLLHCFVQLWQLRSFQTASPLPPVYRMPLHIYILRGLNLFHRDVLVATAYLLFYVAKIKFSLSEWMFLRSVT
jgi:hypothetical protein